MISLFSYLTQHLGVAAVGLLMFLENVFPPIPSEIVLSIAGVDIAKNGGSLLLTLFSSIVGVVLGALVWYGIGRLFTPERIKKFTDRFGRILTMHHNEIDHAEAWFEKRGKLAVFFGRFIPAVRTLISIPAGVVKMNLGVFMLLTAIASGIWNLAFLFIGFYLGGKGDHVIEIVDMVSKVVILLLVFVYVYRFITYKKRG